MTWSFEVEGQPISWNAAYRIGTVVRSGRGGRLRLGHDGSIVERRSIIKTDAAKAYTALAAARAAEARPSHWGPTGLVVVEFTYYLGTDIDCDNVMKLINDGIQAATGVNDRWFLPRAMWKTTGLRPNQRKVVVVVDP